MSSFSLKTQKLDFKEKKFQNENMTNNNTEENIKEKVLKLHSDIEMCS